MSENGLFFYFYFFYPTLKKQNEKDLEIRFNVIFSRHILHTQTLAVNKTFPRSRPSWHTYCAFNITFNKRSIAEKKTKKQHFLGLISFSAHIFFLSFCHSFHSFPFFKSSARLPTGIWFPIVLFRYGYYLSVWIMSDKTLWLWRLSSSCNSLLFFLSPLISNHKPEDSSSLKCTRVLLHSFPSVPHLISQFPRGWRWY